VKTMNVIFFDLDNTLYDSEIYYDRAFKSISEFLQKEFKVEQESSFDFLYSNWKKTTSMYNQMFDDVINKFDLKISTFDLVKIFNEQEVYESDLFSDTIPVLQKLSNKFKLGIITDGDVSRQKRKLRNCKLHDFANFVIYTKEIEPKPSPKPFQHALNQLSSSTVRPFYVADNPKIDFKGAKQLNFSTIRIIRGEFKNIDSDEYVDYSIEKLYEIEKIIEEN
tara:strand:+ start:248 stop:913 length:666 start_codon:yes stop_codon:yes gene_type:complete